MRSGVAICLHILSSPEASQHLLVACPVAEHFSFLLVAPTLTMYRLKPVITRSSYTIAVINTQHASDCCIDFHILCDHLRPDILHRGHHDVAYSLKTAHTTLDCMVIALKYCSHNMKTISSSCGSATWDLGKLLHVSANVMVPGAHVIEACCSRTRPCTFMWLHTRCTG